MPRNPVCPSPGQLHPRPLCNYPGVHPGPEHIRVLHIGSRLLPAADSVRGGVAAPRLSGAPGSNVKAVDVRPWLAATTATTDKIRCSSKLLL